MNKKQKVKYVVAIYGIVLCLSIILTIIAYSRDDGTFSEALWLNLATELLGVVLVFFLVNFLFSLDDWNLSEKVQELIMKFENAENASADNFFHDKKPIKDIIKGASQIDLCGVALSTTIDSHLSDFRNFLRAGGKLRVLIMENTEDNLKIASNRSEEDDGVYYQKKIDATLHNIKYLSSNTKGNSDYLGAIEVGVLAYPPSFRIQKFEGGGQPGLCTVEIYAHHVGWGDPPTFTLFENSDKRWFEYFSKQFEAMWLQSKRIY